MPVYKQFATYLIFLIFISALNGCEYGLKKQEAKISELEGKISVLTEETVPMKFMVMQRTLDSVFVRVKMYYPSGKELASRNVALPGTEIVFDFLSVEVGSQYLAFPVKVFTDQMAPMHGFDLRSLYNVEGFPAIYASVPSHASHNETMRALYAQILKQPDSIPASFGNAVHDVRELRLFDIGRLYRVVSRSRGGIEIMDN